MIREKIVVEYYKNLQTKEITLDYDFEQELRTYKREYRVFKNNGKVSKTDMCQYDIVNKEAERLLAERINLKLEAKEDEKRAITLARIVRKVYKNVVKKDPEAAENIDWNYIEKLARVFLMLGSLMATGKMFSLDL